MWPAIFALSALLQAGGTVAGPSCEPNRRDAPTTAIPRAADVARTLALGMLGVVSESGAAEEIGVDR